MNRTRSGLELKMKFKSQKRKKQRGIAYIISSSTNQKTTGRSTMGVHLINLDDDAKVSTIAKVEPEQPEADDEKNLSSDENSTEQTESSNDQKDSQDSSSNQE